VKSPKVIHVFISRQKCDLLSKRGENRRRNKLGVDRHGDWQDQFTLWSSCSCLFPCYLFYFCGLRFELIVLHLQSSAQPLEPYLQSILLWLFWKWGVINNFSRWFWLSSWFQFPQYLGLQGGATSARIFVVFFGFLTALGFELSYSRLESLCCYHLSDSTSSFLWWFSST
jgi:hypothetical protein